jgi:hypothetical protein
LHTEFGDARDATKISEHSTKRTCISAAEFIMAWPLPGKLFNSTRQPAFFKSFMDLHRPAAQQSLRSKDYISALVV